MTNSNFQFARRCTLTGRGINSGWNVGTGSANYIANLEDVARMAIEEGYASLEEAIIDEWVTYHPVLKFAPDGWYESEREDGTGCRFVDSKQQPTPVFKFARKCDVTGEGMNEGWVIGGGDSYIKHEADALAYAKEQGYASIEDAFDEDAIYWTEWDADDDEDEWFESQHEDGRDAVLVTFE